MNRYETYQDSGIPWLGEVPAHWEVKRLRYILNLNPAKSELHLPADTLVSFIPMEAVNYNKYLTLTQEKFIDEVYKGYTYFRDNDVIVAKITPCFENGKSAIAQNLTNEIAFGTTELHVLRANSLIYNQFLYYLIKSDLFMKIGESEMYGAGGQKRIPEEFIKNFSIGLPPLPEQTAIADYLDNKLGEIDALISKQETLLEKLAEQRTAMITHAVTKGLNAHAPMKNSGVAWLGDVPEHWEIKKLKYLCKIVTGYTPSKNNDENYDENGFLWVKPDNLNDFSEIYETKEKISTLGLRDGSLIPRGSILVCSIGTIGKMGIAGKDLLTNQQINSFIFNEKVNELFRKYLVYSAKGIFEYMANDNVVRILNSNTQKNIFFIVPPLPEQTAIANYLDEQTAKIDRLSDTVNQTIASLKEYRSALITQAVTGKIKVI